MIVCGVSPVIVFGLDFVVLDICFGTKRENMDNISVVNCFVLTLQSKPLRVLPSSVAAASSPSPKSIKTDLKLDS